MIELQEKRQDRVESVSVPAIGSPVAGRYRLHEQLGRGATAIVFRAYDQRTERDVALKVFTRTPSRRLWRRVAREARAMGLVDSPHVVRMYDVSGENDELLWISLELCREYRNNTPIGAVALLEQSRQCDGRPTSVKEAAAWAEQIALGIHEAHRKGVFHRDLKPANILLQPVNRKAKVSDFGQGAADLQRQGRSTDADAWRTVTIHRTARGLYGVGTPPYMAPEQVRGTVKLLDPEVKSDQEQLTAIDIYGIGATLYELIAERPPYLPTERATDQVQDVLEQIERGPPEPLDEVATVWQLPKRLRRIIETAMAREAEDRYASAADFAADLGAFVRDEPSSLDRRGRYIPLRIALFLKRNWPIVLTVATAAALFLVVVVASAQMVSAAEQAREQVRSQKRALEHEKAEAEERLVATRVSLVENKDKLDRANQVLRTTTGALEETIKALSVQRDRLARTRVKLAAVWKARERVDGQVSQLSGGSGGSRPRSPPWGTSRISWSSGSPSPRGAPRPPRRSTATSAPAG